MRRNHKCKSCFGRGWAMDKWGYMSPCMQCCEHKKGFTYYKAANGWACNNGCAFVLPFNPEEKVRERRSHIVFICIAA